MAERETWTSRIGFIFAAVGSAVGLGNIWSFPFQTAANGGAAFLVVYLLAVFLIGFPTMMVEFVIGRRGESNPVAAFEKLGYGNWSFTGGLGVFSSLVTLSFYSVVGGWVLSYIAGSVTGGYFGDAGAYFGSVASGPVAIGAHLVFMAITIGIVASGVTDGIERATKVMIPAILVLLVGLAAWATTLEGATAGYEYYLSPDFGVIASNFGSIVPPAMGQAFFTLSLGFSVMIAYSSYLGRDDSLPADGGAIVVVNTLVALLAGFVVFPILFATGGAEGAGGGAGTAFIALAGAFGNLPAGGVIGFVFFAVLLFAALSSSISLLEVPVSYVTENYGVGRRTTALAMGAAIAVIGLPATFGTTWLDFYNDVVFNLLLPISVFLLAIFVGWVADREAIDELGRGSSIGSSFTTAWLWWVRIVVPTVVLMTLWLGLETLYEGLTTGGYF
ncbi:sodium-dependent transporter [Halorussus gelatinilyticus]|uniref:Sodium-dependent transporter n=1 Tax=Halorussus gelatinilyticus TaxID=2937524 RepID=A0A8U0IIP9_9EURY|nr:sodium-dependent transporter [Halorussus gelatinilyticus]UPW00668.1 sodium-dependent transporter [Halorussus gelatinilyticus]